jgi:hypothetical protein
VGLGEGRGGDRVAELAVELFQRPPDRSGDLGLGDGRGEGIQPVLQPRKVLGEGGAEDVRAGGEELAELDGDRPLALEGQGQALAGPPAPGGGAAQQAYDPGQAAPASRRCAPPAICQIAQP